MICPGCGHDNPAGSRYCNMCAVSLGKIEDSDFEASPDDSAEESESDLVAVPDSDRPYVKFEFPWSWLATVTQTKGQFLVSTFFFLSAGAFFALVFAAFGRFVESIGIAALFLVIWWLRWAIGRSGAGG